jgi:hypothetical protein
LFLQEVTVMDESAYEACRARLDRAHERMLAISGGPHPPADARRAAAELAAALREATSGAARLMRSATATSDVAHWSSELVRLSEIGVWLRRTTLDDIGVHVPTTVRVGNYAANAPHIAGLGVGAGDLAELHQPRIGIDLPAIVDGIDGDSATTAVAPAVSAPVQAA